MRNEMKPVPFRELLEECIKEYKEKSSLFSVPVVDNMFDTPMGPAAGPHTQMAQNIISAYAAGATVFELKTVQILEGEELGIVKPCIYVGSEVYNTEWSTELTVKEAAAEYIKAAVLMQVLAKEFGLRPFETVRFIMSVGYHLEGISSPKVDAFIESMKEASDTEEWKKDIACLKDNMKLFERLSPADIEAFSPVICDTVTLSTMHGCPAGDIELIAKYLMTEKKLNTYIKMNPTLLGKDEIYQILATRGYDVMLPEEMFSADINLDEATSIINACRKTAEAEGLFFGIKLTNTLPVQIQNGELSGEQMYMSGPSLYALSINVAKLLAERFDGALSISYSGGIDDKNMTDVLETGIAPVTVSSYLLKPGGYRNLSKLIVDACIPGEIDLVKINMLSKHVIEDINYNKKAVKKYKKQDKYDSFCSVCHNCEDICPNRANRRIKVDGQYVVVHNNKLCNECGACAFSCVMGHLPYQEKASRWER